MTKTGASSATARNRGRPPAGAHRSASGLHGGGDLRPRVLGHLLGQGLDRPCAGAGVSRVGTATSRVTSRSPARPLPGTPRPRTRSVRPLAVPAGTLSETVPSRVGTVSVVPRDASAKVIGTVSVRSSPLRPNSECSATWTTTNRSPAGPPRRPGAPLPASRMRWPSLTPAGMRTVIVRVWVVTPLPRAGRARVVDHLTGAAAVAARLGERERALAAAGDAGALADRAGVRARCRAWRRCRGRSGRCPGSACAAARSRRGRPRRRRASPRSRRPDPAPGRTPPGCGCGRCRPPPPPPNRPPSRSPRPPAPRRRRRRRRRRRTGRRGRTPGRRRGSRRRGSRRHPHRRRRTAAAPRRTRRGAWRRRARRRPRRPP